MLRLLAPFAALACAASLALTGAARGDADAAEPRAFTIPWFTTAGGALVRDMTIAWDSAGRLDFRGENAVLIIPDPRRPGESALDLSSGPLGRALEAGRLFALRPDAPCGPGAATTGPESIDPETGAAWGDDFPDLSARDLVAVQKALAESLGVRRVRAVVGAGFGGLLALEWRRRYSHMTGRAIAVGPPPRSEPGDTSCLANILRRHGGVDADWIPNDADAIAQALAALAGD